MNSLSTAAVLIVHPSALSPDARAFGQTFAAVLSGASIGLLLFGVTVAVVGLVAILRRR